ncbi:hypothetical protein ACFQDN_14555 [Pseudomonas asuensis]|uniref:Uncharacterized protein n=1 Tax=Pseudomonas asuensis TaxID=1825787 RepID=A0ABQ2H1U9_9PSED|nr:hypothetical protein [Pseudomonas asuensis]GGM23756.1 hypothetical protein GCM10009425_38290 [Pseudomonas asuensis]
MSAQILVYPKTPPELIAARSFKGLTARLERLGFSYLKQIRFRRQPFQKNGLWRAEVIISAQQQAQVHLGLAERIIGLNN